MRTKIYHYKDYLIEQLKTKSYVQLAEEHNVDESTIQRYMRKHKLTNNKGKTWTDKEIRLLKEKYGRWWFDVYELFPYRTPSSIFHKSSRLGLKRLVKKREYSINHDFFKRWSNEMAYILGIFFSDGSVSYDRQYISIHLNKKDHYILEKIMKKMGSNRPVPIYGNSSHFRIDSKILTNDLIDLGCIPRKTYFLEFPNISDKFLSHFIRGYFDGDGSIHFNKPNTIKITFCGTKQFIEGLQNRLNKILKLRIHPIYKYKNNWRCIYYSDDARKLCFWMYKDTKDLYLKRKKERFKDHIKKR